MKKNALGLFKFSLLCLVSGWLAACGIVGVQTGGGGGGTDGGESENSDGTPRNALLVRVLTVGGPETLANAKVKLGNGATATTDESGMVLFTDVPASDGLVVSVEEPGYAEAIQRVSVHEGGFGFVDLTLVKAHATARFDAASGGTVDDGTGGRAMFPPNGLVTQAGAPVTGAVDVSIAPLKLADAEQRKGYPSGFEGKRASDGASVLMAALAPMGIVARQGDAVLQVAPGKHVEITIPVPESATDAPTTVPLWSLSPSTGVWVEEGTAVAQADERAPSRRAYHASIPHLSWWNGTQWLPSVCFSGNVVDVNGGPAAYVPITAYSRRYGATFRGISNSNGFVNCLIVPTGDAALTVVAARPGGGPSATQTISTLGLLDNRLSGACIGCYTLPTMFLRSQPPPPPPAPSPPNPILANGWYLIALDPNSTWTANVGIINAACTPPNPFELGFADLGWIASLRAESNRVDCCTCTARSRNFSVPLSSTSTARLTGVLFDQRSPTAPYSLGSLRVQVKMGNGQVGRTRILATQNRPNNNCAGSSELPAVMVNNAVPFQLRLSTVAPASQFDHLQIDLNSYGCGTEIDSVAVALLMLTP